MSRAAIRILTNVWVSVESHRIRMPGDRPLLHVFKTLERQVELGYLARMLDA
jgi:hypothetical protein